MPGPSPHAPAVPAATAASSAAVPAGATAAILARPLFSPSRRPAAIVAAGREPLPRLTGIIIEKDRRTALFAAVDGGKPLALNEDGRVAGFTVQRIEAGEITLVGPGGPRSLRPTFDPSRPAPPPQGVDAPGGLAGLLAPAGGAGLPGLGGLNPGAVPNPPPLRPVAR